MNTKVLILLAVATVVAADSREFYAYAAPHGSSEESYESSEAQYNFNWAVNHDDSGNNFGHQEARDGEDTQGSYYVQLPDGRLQTVNYRVEGDSGYLAQVNYEGQARYPDSFESFESREYTPPRPVRFESHESREFVPSRPRHFDSHESREFFPFRPRPFDSLESFESRVFVPSRPRPFDSHESFNSFESREFAPLTRVYG